jgi:DNA-binding transcriptional regulator YiaG
MEAAELKQRRADLGLSINGLAHEFRCAPSSIKRWEDGQIVLQGLMAIGADTVLHRLERERRAGSGRGTPAAEGEGGG